MPMYRIQFQMVDTFEVIVNEDTAEKAKAHVRTKLEEGETFSEDREFISWDTGTVRVVERLN